MGRLNIEKQEGIENQKFTVSDGTISYDEVSKMYPSYNRRMDNRLFLFFDDVVAFTSVGLVDFLNVYVYKNSNFNYYLDTFLERNNKYLDGIKYASRVIEVNQNVKLTEDALKITLKQNYLKIFHHSPISGALNSLAAASKSLQVIHLAFKYKFEEAEIILKSMKNLLFYDSPVEIVPVFLEEIKLEDYLPNSNINCIYGGNSWECYQIAVTKQMLGTEFYVNFCHNGFSLDFLDKWTENPINSNELGHKLYFYHDTILNSIDPAEFFRDEQANIIKRSD